MPIFLGAAQALERLMPNLKANIPACITTTKQRPARSIVDEGAIEKTFELSYILNVNRDKCANLQLVTR